MHKNVFLDTAKRIKQFKIFIVSFFKSSAHIFRVSFHKFNLRLHK